MNPVSQPKLYTAARIAAALGLKRQTVCAGLSYVPAVGTVNAGGIPAKAWTLAALPEALRERLASVASASGCREEEHLLALATNQQRPWNAKDALGVTLAECADETIDQARKLQTALATALKLRNNPTQSRAELQAMGLRDYQAAFGHNITARHWQRLYDRTVQRAGAAADFTRLELFLPDRIKRRQTAAPAAPQSVPEEFAGLAQLIGAFKNPATPNDEETHLVWDEAFLWLNNPPAAGDSQTERKRRLLAFLRTHAPFLSDTADGLRAAFNRKFDRWLATGTDIKALEDGRKQRQPPVERLNETERKYFTWLAAKFQNVSLGWRKFLASDKATTETKTTYGRCWQPPRWARDLVTRDARNLQDHLRGPRTAKLNGAFIERDPNALASGDSDQSDDLTLPLFWWDETPDGLWIGQGQLLAWIDERSWMFYSLDLITDRAYSGFSIRNSWTCKAEEHGLPRKKIHVEMGIWRNAKVFVGSRDEVGTEETELGLRRLGIRLHHATLPRGKVIERVFGSLQDLMQTEPGYAGRCQPVDKFEMVQTQLKLCRAGKEHPERFFYHKSQIIERLLEIGAEYNRTPKFGKYHGGLTPKEVYEKHWTTPLVKIPDECRHLLADNKIEATVGRNGVSFRFGNQPFTYKASQELGQRKGQRVIVWFSPERPEFCTVTDMNSEHPLVVAREPLVPSDGATDEQLARAMSANATFNGYYKDLHRALKTRFNHEFEQHRFRPVVVDRQTLEQSAAIREQTAALQAEQKETSRLITQGRRAASRLGMYPGVIRRPDQLAAAERLAQLLRDDEPETTEASQ